MPKIDTNHFVNIYVVTNQCLTYSDYVGFVIVLMMICNKIKKLKNLVF